MGYKEVVFKSDQEPALCNFIEVVKANWNGDAVLENSPVGESESNGAVEKAIQTWEGQVRTMKDALEYRIGGENSARARYYDLAGGVRGDPLTSMSRWAKWTHCA